MTCRRSIQFVLMSLAWLRLPSNEAVAAEKEPTTEHSAAWLPWKIKRWTTENQLPQSRISAIKQTHDGYLWVGTSAGLARFEGLSFKTFARSNTVELAEDTITALAEDEAGTLWIGTKDGLVGRRDDQFHRLTIKDGLPDHMISRLVSSRKGGIWVQAGSYVTRLYQGKFLRASKFDFSANPILSLTESDDGSLIVVQRPYLLTLSGDALQIRTNGLWESPGGPDWLAALPDEQSRGAWLGTAQGLRLGKDGAAQVVAGVPSDAVSVPFIAKDRGGGLWISTEARGLLRREQTNWVALGETVGLGKVGITCMEEDMEGSIWLGTDEGLVQLVRQPVRTYTTQNGLAHNNVFSVCEGKDGAIWVGTDRGLSCIVEGRVVLCVQDAQVERTDRCIWPNGRGGVWLAKPSAELLEFQDRQFVNDSKPLKCRALINVLYQDRSGRLLLGTENGLFTLTNSRFQRVEVGLVSKPTPLSPESGVSRSPAYELRNANIKDQHQESWLGDVHCILEDHAGTFWFGRKGRGLARWRGGAPVEFAVEQGLSHNDVWSLHEDADGTLWIGTDDGLTRLRNGKLFPFRKEQGLPAGYVNCVLEDDAGYLWLSRKDGIYRLDKAELNAVADGRERTVQPIVLGTADGMEHPETNGGENQPAGCKAKDGKLWFPTVRGVVVVDPRLVPTNIAPPQVVVEGVKADEEEVISPKHEVRSEESGGAGQKASAPRTSQFAPRIPAGHGHMVEFRFAINTFIDSERASYRYRLRPIQKEWREERGQRAVRYPNLSPGDYQFEVTAANHQGVWNPQPATFSFSLTPSFWQTWVFYGLCAGAVAGMAAGLHVYRLRWQQRLLKVEEQRALASERSRIARDLHDDLGGSLTGLALQLEAAKQSGQATEADLGMLAQEARSLTHDLRELAWATNPRCDTALSLVTFVGDLAERFARSSGLACHLELPQTNGVGAVPARLRHEAVMVLKESLANVAKHAQARSVTVSLGITDGQVRLEVKDDGRGFDANRLSAGSGLGNMRERIEQAGGTFALRSQPGSGTTVSVLMPMRRE